MRIFTRPTGLHSRAMIRVSKAIEASMPKSFTIGTSPEDADVQVLHVIGPTETPKDKDYIVIQYCGSLTPDAYTDLWANARMVWSYYDLEQHMGKTPFLYAPLGVDGTFRKPGRIAARSIGLITSGFSTAPGQEPIQEAVMAVSKSSGAAAKMVHIGPSSIEGWEGAYPECWQNQIGITDQTLAMLYRNAWRVSGLRCGEGFELPGLEGASQGAVPVVYDRPDMRAWYDGFAEFVPECRGEELVERLTTLFKTAPTEISAQQLQVIRSFFDWDRIMSLFWAKFSEGSVPRITVNNTKRRLLWIGDAVASTGFAKGTHYVCDKLSEQFDVTILGLNYYGDPHPYRQPIFPAISGGDPMGFGRVKDLIESEGPSVVVVQNDPWNIPEYLKRIGNVPTVGYIAIDGKNADGEKLNGLTHSIFWTEFAREQANLGGYTGPSSVVPLGVDTNVFFPQDRKAVRASLQLDRILADRGLSSTSFIVGVVGRNQWRKRLDLTVEYFAEWVYSKAVPDALLWIHSAPTKDDAWDLARLGRYYNIADRMVVPKIQNSSKGVHEESLARFYNMFDVLFTTTMGEGMWLPGLEAAACGTPIIAPDWSAVGELFAGAASLVPCTSTASHPGQTCTIGGIAGKYEAVRALHSMYANRELRAELGESALKRVREDRFNWDVVGRSFTNVVEKVLYTQPVHIHV